MKFRKLPLFRKIYGYVDGINEQLACKERENQLLANEVIDQRLREKKRNGEKINVVFVCHRPAVWESLRSVYDELKKDSRFNVFVVAIPNKREKKGAGLNHEEYETEGAEEFWKEYGCINGYDYESGHWLDLRTLKPDYVFFQQPYNITRSPWYKSWIVSKYAKICYVAYAFDFIGDGVLEETTPPDFFQNVSFFFTQNSIDNKMVKAHLTDNNNSFTEFKVSGFPRYDRLEVFKNTDQPLWKYKGKDKRFRVLWTPRWCTNEGNCTFFEYNEKLTDFFCDNVEYEFVFRPHPQAFMNWERTGEYPAKKQEAYKQKYLNSSNMSIDTRKEYFDTIFSSDCLISDVSSFVADYFLSGKPVIYCHKKNMFNELSEHMAEGFYWVSSWQELEDTVNSLKAGDDPLKEKRQELIGELFGSTSGGRAAEKIKEYILEDALK